MEHEEERFTNERARHVYEQFGFAKRASCATRSIGTAATTHWS